MFFFVTGSPKGLFLRNMRDLDREMLWEHEPKGEYNSLNLVTRGSHITMQMFYLKTAQRK